MLRQRLENGLKNISFFVVPSAVAFVVLGDVVVATIYRGGQFQSDRCDVCVECAGGFGCGPAGYDFGQAVFLCVLCVAGYAHAVELRDHSRGVDGRAWAICSRCRFPGCWALIATGGSPGSRFRRAWRDGWSLRCFAARCRRASVQVVASVSRVSHGSGWAPCFPQHLAYGVKLMLPFHAPRRLHLVLSTVGDWPICSFGLLGSAARCPQDYLAWKLTPALQPWTADF